MQVSKSGASHEGARRLLLTQTTWRRKTVSFQPPPSNQKNLPRTLALKWRVSPLTPGARPKKLSETLGGPATKNGKCPGKPDDSACSHWNVAGTRPHDLHVEFCSAVGRTRLTATGLHPPPGCPRVGEGQPPQPRCPPSGANPH